MSEYYKKANLKAHLESIMPEGYEINNPASYESFMFKKILSDRFYRMLLVDTTDFPIDAQFMGVINLAVSFNEVEALLKYACDNTPDSPYEHEDDDYIFQIVLQPDGGKDEAIRIWRNAVSDDESFERIRPDLEKLIGKALNFIDNHPTLENWVQYFESLDTFDKQVDTLTQPFAARYMIIKKLLNSSDYESYSSYVINFYTTEKIDPLKANFLQVLKDKLDTLPTNYLES